jgi:hypothetical protein
MTDTQTTEIALFDEVCAAYEARIAAREHFAEVERKSARDSKIRVGCLCLMIGLLAGGIFSL